MLRGVFFSSIMLAYGPVFAAGHVLDNGRVHVDFADPASGYTAVNNDRVDSLTWTNPGGATTANLVTEGGPLHCNDPQEFFGQAYGDGANSHPYLIFAGDTASWRSPSATALTGNTKVNTKAVCDNAFDGGTASTYRLAKSTAQINQMTVVRTFTFTTPNSTGDLRVYVPRLPLSQYAAVTWPNSAGVIQSIDANQCEFNCLETDWNGTWFAEQTSAGQGLMIIRNPAKGNAALLVIDNDGYSSSNNSAVALAQPSGGWSGKYVETENLCFFDATTWPAARKAAGKLPLGCSVP